MTRPRVKKPKPIKVELIGRTTKDGKTPNVYTLLDQLVGRYHPHLAEAKIALAWHDGWKANADGRVRLGKAIKAGDLDRQLHGFDFVLVLNRPVLALDDWTPDRTAALIDHELCHCQVARDMDGEVKRDAKGRPVWRIRKHDIEEFVEIVARHGCYKRDLEAFGRVVMDKAGKPLLAGLADAAPKPNRTPIPAKTGRSQEVGGRRHGNSASGDRPAAPGKGSDSPAGADDAWRSVRLDALADPDISPRVLKALADHEPPITTLGELVDWQKKKGDFWAEDIKGLGPSGSGQIEEAATGFWARRARDQEDAAKGAKAPGGSERAA